MITIREYTEEDAEAVGKLIADTYSQFNLAHLSPGEVKLALGPFQYAWSDDETHNEKIAIMIRSEWVFVAVDEDKIVGVIRGRQGRLASLFVRSEYHRQGVARGLVARFEEECQKYAPMVIRLSATVYAVPFYIKMGYKRSTGIRSGWSFDYHGLPMQPMRKVLRAK